MKTSKVAAVASSRFVRLAAQPGRAATLCTVQYIMLFSIETRLNSLNRHFTRHAALAGGVLDSLGGDRLSTSLSVQPSISVPNRNRFKAAAVTSFRFSHYFCKKFTIELTLGNENFRINQSNLTKNFSCGLKSRSLPKLLENLFL